MDRKLEVAWTRSAGPTIDQAVSGPLASPSTSKRPSTKSMSAVARMAIKSVPADQRRPAGADVVT
jgi:hypothetical protein